MENNENLKQELLALKELLTKYDNAFRKAVSTWREPELREAHKCVDYYKTKRKEFFDLLDSIAGTQILLSIVPIAYIIGQDALIGAIMLVVLQGVFIIQNRKDFKKMINAKKYLKENKTSYEGAKQTIKKYDTEIEPQLAKECHQIYEMIVEKIESIKRTSNVFAEFEGTTRNQTVIFETGFQDTRTINKQILDQTFAKYGIEQELDSVCSEYDVEPVQTQASENSKPKVRKLSQ